MSRQVTAECCPGLHVTKFHILHTELDLNDYGGGLRYGEAVPCLKV